MNEKLSFEKKSSKKNFFNNIFIAIKNNIIIFLILFSLFLTLIFSTIFFYKSASYSTLYNKLSNEDKNEIIFELSNMNIPYKISGLENKISIPKKLVYQVRFNLSEKGIPRNNIDGFEILDQEKFGESQFHERINYQRALEGELSKTIMKIDSIKNACVHLVMHSKSVFLNNDVDASASILLTLKSGKLLDVNKINAILHLVSKSVSGLKYKNITIVDQYGNFLNQKVDFDTYNNSKLIYLSEIEKKYKRKIEEILIPLFGVNNVHAQVTAQADFDKKEKIEERYKPNSEKFNKSIRSSQNIYNREFHKNKNNSNNLENNLVKHFDEKKYDEKNKNFNSNILGKNQNSKNDHNFNNSDINNNYEYSNNYDNTTNYELDHDITNTKVNIGSLKRISVGVVINYVKDSNGKFFPISKNDMQKIKELIKNTIGFSKERGDTVNLVNSLFFNNTAEKEKIKYVIVKKNNTNFLFRECCFIIFSIIILFFLYKIFFICFFKKKIKNKDIDKELKNKDIDKELKNKDIDKELKNKMFEKNKKNNFLKKQSEKQKSSNSLIVTKQNKNNKNIFDKKSSFIAKIIQNWINEK
ncbi:flagellar basal-body MS-ring/collar protein FliF [Buchnera aphidicola]|uniref:flagellar basal-body MS-ring/collar protein FliF n=1 Tax=Buchnera aphidicola TaxID=9 RepID=UPI0031B89C34